LGLAIEGKFEGKWKGKSPKMSPKQLQRSSNLQIHSSNQLFILSDFDTNFRGKMYWKWILEIGKENWIKN
jgi:hypothetical protein